MLWLVIQFLEQSSRYDCPAFFCWYNFNNLLFGQDDGVLLKKRQLSNWRKEGGTSSYTGGLGLLQLSSLWPLMRAPGRVLLCLGLPLQPLNRTF